MKKVKVARCFTPYRWIPLKYFVDTIIAALSLVEAPNGWESIVRHLRRYRLTIVLDALVAIVCFEVGVVLQSFSGVRILTLSAMLGGSLLSLFFLGCIKLLLGVGHTNPHREMNAADLLGREVVPLQTPEAQAVLKGQIILVTGAAGSIGSELCRQLLDYEPKLIIALDTNETGLFDLAENLRSHPYAARLHAYIGDITNVERMSRLFTEEQPDLVFHVAAYKHVPLLEQHPDQAIRTNVLATYHLCRLAQKHGVAHFIFISSDKAAEPVGVMGASKRIGELTVQVLGMLANCTTRFCAVRFGNVIGSRGSVVPVFAQQIKQGGPVTVTDPEATRYFMTISEACGLVILTATIAAQGGLYVLDMGCPVRIMDLAKKMIRSHGLRMGRDIPIVYTGLRPGERLHETLVGPNEELILTAHSKIFCVTDKDILPTFTTLAQWMNTLDNSLRHESNAQLRKRLFEVVREQELIVTVD